MLLKKYSDELSETLKRIKSFKLALHGYQVISYYYLKTKQFTECINTINEAKEYFHNKPFRIKYIDFIFNTDLLSSHIALQDWIKAVEIVENNYQLLSKGSFNWFRNFDQHRTLLIFTSKYNIALNMLSEELKLFKNVNNKSLSQSIQVKEAYLHALLQMGKIDKNALDFEPRKF